MALDIPEVIQADADAALEHLNAKAIVLFGSRVRDDWREDSDWDIACITEADTDNRISLFHQSLDTWHEVNYFVVPEHILIDRSRYVGDVYRDIAFHGQVLAGAYNFGHLQTGNPVTDYRLFVTHIVRAEAELRQGANWYEQIHEKDGAVRDLAYCNSFVSCSSDAAERLAKALLMRLGIDPKPTHDVQVLAQQARNAGHQREAGLIEPLNGHASLGHIAHYRVEQSVGECGVAAVRYVGALKLYVAMMQDLPHTDIVLPEVQYAETNRLLRSVVAAFSVEGDVEGRIDEVCVLLNAREELHTHAVEIQRGFTQFLQRETTLSR